MSAALSIANGSKALICFPDDGGFTNSQKKCEIFDSETSISTFETSFAHLGGGLGFYKGQPTTVGGFHGGSVVKQRLVPIFRRYLRDPPPRFGHFQLEIQPNWADKLGRIIALRIAQVLSAIL